MKVCVVASTIPRFDGDGSGRFVLSISEALATLGHEVHVVAPYHPAVAPFESSVRVHHFRYVLPNSLAIMGYAQAMQSDQALRPAAYALAPLYALSETLLLTKLMRRHRFDVIHAHWVIPNAPVAAGLSRAYGIPLVVSLHGSDIFMALQHRFLQPIARWAFVRAHAVSACSPDLLAGAIKLGADRRKVHLMPWGADPDLFGDEQHCASAQALRKQLGLSPQQPVILTLGRLVRKKGVRFLILAMATVIRHYPEAHCLVAGAGPELDELRALVDDLGLSRNVTFVGAVAWQDVGRYLAGCDIFVAPSVHDENGNADQLPTTILEAMAAARPVVASQVSGIPLAVAHGETGFLVAEGNPQQLAEALLCLLGSPQVRRLFGGSARTRVERDLNWLQVARRFEELYQSEADNGR